MHEPSLLDWIRIIFTPPGHDQKKISQPEKIRSTTTSKEMEPKSAIVDTQERALPSQKIDLVKKPSTTTARQKMIAHILLTPPFALRGR